MFQKLLLNETPEDLRFGQQSGICHFSCDPRALAYMIVVGRILDSVQAVTIYFPRLLIAVQCI